MKKQFKITTGEEKAPEDKIKGKVPPISDMVEGSDAEEASETPNEEDKEIKVEGDESNTGKIGNIDKENLKDAIKEVNAEKDLGYTVNGRSKYELETLIKLAQGKLDKKDYSDNKDNNSVPTAKY